MSSADSEDRTDGDPEGGVPPRRFRTTQWTLVLAAGDTSRRDSREALADLCGRYWYPLYAYVRRRGHGAAEAEDLTQGFFATLIEKNYLGDADRSRGRFRTFLLTSLKHYLANEWHRGRARKRGGGAPVLSLDVDDAEARFRLEPAEATTPEEVYDRRWAHLQLGNAMERLAAEMEETGRSERFTTLRPYLTGQGADVPYRDAARSLGTSEGAVKVAVHRLRKRFGELLREEIAATVAEAEVDDELRHLFASLDG